MEQTKQNNRQREQIPHDVVYIGKNPTKNYILAVVTKFNSGEKEVKLIARGEIIKKAIDVKEVISNRYMVGIKTEITSSTEQMPREIKGKQIIIPVSVITVRFWK